MPADRNDATALTAEREEVLREDCEGAGDVAFVLRRKDALALFAMLDAERARADAAERDARLSAELNGKLTLSIATAERDAAAIRLAIVAEVEDRKALLLAVSNLSMAVAPLLAEFQVGARGRVSEEQVDAAVEAMGNVQIAETRHAANFFDLRAALATPTGARLAELERAAREVKHVLDDGDGEPMADALNALAAALDALDAERGAK